MRQPRDVLAHLRQTTDKEIQHESLEGHSTTQKSRRFSEFD